MNIVPLDLASDRDLMRQSAQGKQLICFLQQKKEKKKGFLGFGVFFWQTDSYQGTSWTHSLNGAIGVLMQHSM